ncbi:hypothetical protein OAD84_01230 [Pelagibacterales bacterium]|nr:hypothetical protein [Pelagibacterales bacterium]
MVIDFLKWVKGAILDKHFLYSLSVFVSFILLFGIDVISVNYKFLDSEYEGSYITAIASFMMIFFIGVINIRFFNYTEEHLKYEFSNNKKEINFLLKESNFLKFYIKLWNNEKIERIWILPSTLFFGWLYSIALMFIFMIIMLPFLLMEFYFDFDMIEDIRTILNSGIINI